MATYNGASYLDAQIISIINQSYSNWRLYIRDDGSFDKTVDIIKGYVAQDDRIRLVEDGLGQKGATHNFGCLLQHAFDAGELYFCLSDQDDVWSEDKLKILLQKMEADVRLHGESPLLIHSDLCVVDEKLNVIHESFMEYQCLQHEEQRAVNVLLAQNFVTGCTVLLNRSLLERALPIPDGAVIHDWWLALSAAVFGSLKYIDQPLVRYRQHGANVVGAKSFSGLLNPLKTDWIRQWLKGRENLKQSMVQAHVLADRIRQVSGENASLELVEQYASLLKQSRLNRLNMLRINRIHFRSKLRRLLMVTRLMTIPRSNR